MNPLDRYVATVNPLDRCVATVNPLDRCVATVNPLDRCVATVNPLACCVARTVSSRGSLDHASLAQPFVSLERGTSRLYARPFGSPREGSLDRCVARLLLRGPVLFRGIARRASLARPFVSLDRLTSPWFARPCIGRTVPR
ncbi:MAG: hypothetical protein KF782_17275, partial [Labilithrix sp.]|nr:hypothetical protein [Labilithrix sp.]